MYALRIVNPTFWNNNWSAEIGQKLKILNSTYNLFVFDKGTIREEIIQVLEEIPPAAYTLLQIHPSEPGHCEIFTDNGQCYEQE
ncbi:hypothetical protein [Geopsychrobacter electrodiphilus]|uniref:hypothetical protein n=1 Tax=Geopsychrobacter electrodiphilus TaxID=225196 RepID=UPI00036D92CB|nr:hypothetical protein [Geopsychrobacter electrodiphilus]